MLAAYRRVLRNGPLSRLLIGEFVSSIGDWLYLVALLVVIYERQRDPFVLGIVGAARVLPYVFLSIPAGIAADRYDRRLILLVTDLARSAVMLVLAYLVATRGAIELIVALTILATCFSAFFSPAIGAYLPNLVHDENDLGPANSAWASLDNLAFIIGPAVAGLLIAVGGLPLGFLLNAVSFLVIALILWRLPPSRAGATAGDRRDAGDAAAEDERVRSPMGAASEPVGAVLRRLAAPLLGLQVIAVVAGFVFGGLGVLTVVLAVEVLGGDESATGALNAATGVGGVLGALVSGALVLRRRLGPPLLAGGLVLAGSVVVLGQTTSLVVALGAMALGAAGSLLVDVVTTTLFQRVVPDHVRGRVLGIIETIAVVAYAAGSFAIPVLALSVGVPVVLAVSGVAVAAATGVAAALLGGRLAEAPAEDDPRASLRDVPILSGLSPARIEEAMRRAEVVRVAAGTVVVRQGDPADRFYVIHRGTFQVTQRADGASDATERTLRRLGPPDVFGEIGLLRAIPRTATVAAVTDAVLVALDRETFLELVAAGPGLTSRLLDLHRGATVPGS